MIPYFPLPNTTLTLISLPRLHSGPPGPPGSGEGGTNIDADIIINLIEGSNIRFSQINADRIIARDSVQVTGFAGTPGRIEADRVDAGRVDAGTVEATDGMQLNNVNVLTDNDMAGLAASTPAEGTTDAGCSCDAEISSLETQMSTLSGRVDALGEGGTGGGEAGPPGPPGT